MAHSAHSRCCPYIWFIVWLSDGWTLASGRVHVTMLVERPPASRFSHLRLDCTWVALRNLDRHAKRYKPPTWMSPSLTTPCMTLARAHARKPNLATLYTHPQHTHTKDKMHD